MNFLAQSLHIGLFTTLILGGSALSYAQSGQRDLEKIAPDRSTTTLDPRDIANQLVSPISDMVSVTGMWSWDQKIGVSNGHAQTLAIVPQIPIHLSNSDYFVVRPTFIGQYQNDVYGNTGSGLSNTMLETFYSRGLGDPNTGDGWGIGPFLVAPAGASGRYGSQQTGGGLDAAIQLSNGPLIYGILGHQSWSLGGLPTSGTQNNLFINPYFAYVASNRWTYNFELDSLYNYDAHRTQNIAVGSLSLLQMNNGLPISYQFSAKYNVGVIPGGPQGWGGMFSVSFLLPRLN